MQELPACQPPRTWSHCHPAWTPPPDPCACSAIQKKQSTGGERIRSGSAILQLEWRYPAPGAPVGFKLAAMAARQECRHAHLRPNARRATARNAPGQLGIRDLKTVHLQKMLVHYMRWAQQPDGCAASAQASAPWLWHAPLCTAKGACLPALPSGPLTGWRRKRWRGGSGPHTRPACLQPGCPRGQRLCGRGCLAELATCRG